MSNSEFNTPLPGWMAGSTPVRALCVLYSFFVRWRNLRFDHNPSLCYKPERKVISVGGIRAGGTGKTPVSLMLGQYLSSKQYNVAFLSRGYKRKHKKDLIVHPDRNTDWEEAGDEPAMLHSLLPRSWLGIGARRVKIAAKLSALTPQNTVFVLDDGFQHRQLGRDLDIVCINETTLSDKMIPCGYLREPVDSLSRANVVLLTGSMENTGKLESFRDKLQELFPHTTILILIQEADCWVNAVTGETASMLPLKSPVALCGIARPERFFNMLRSEGVKPCREIAVGDHYIFTEKYFNSIQELYSQGMVTTEKDAFRLLKLKVVICPEFWYLKIRLRFIDLKSHECFNRLINQTISII